MDIDCSGLLAQELLELLMDVRRYGEHRGVRFVDELFEVGGLWGVDFEPGVPQFVAFRGGCEGVGGGFLL